MRIKNYFTIILLLCFFLQAKATGLSGDIISFNGDSWVFMAKPINMDSTLYKRLMDFIPDNHCVSTGNWEGYTAFWEIQNDYLCLQRIEVCVGTAFEDIPDDWVCPLCGVGKDMFSVVEE